MLIDWFTVAAQAVNFLILAWLLKRFLYGPIIEAMGKRRQRLAEEQAKTHAMRQESSRRLRELSDKQEALEIETATILSVARNEAERQRDQWLTEAKDEVQARSREWMDAVERERIGLSEKLKERMAEQVIRVAEKALEDLAGEHIESLVLDGFLSRLPYPGHDAPIKGPISVRTGFPLPEESARLFREQIRERFPNGEQIEMDRDESLGFGIVVVAGDTKWEWNLASYLEEVEDAVFEELAKTKAET